MEFGRKNDAGGALGGALRRSTATLPTWSSSGVAFLRHDRVLKILHKFFDGLVDTKAVNEPGHGQSRAIVSWPGTPAAEG
jgi:hypothetical protein